MFFLLRHLTSEFNSSETTTNNHNFISVFPREYMVLPTFFVTNLKSADMRIDIAKYEEGFLIVVKILKRGVSNATVSAKVRSKTIVKDYS